MDERSAWWLEVSHGNRIWHSASLSPCGEGKELRPKCNCLLRQSDGWGSGAGILALTTPE